MASSWGKAGLFIQVYVPNLRGLWVFLEKYFFYIYISDSEMQDFSIFNNFHNKAIKTSLNRDISIRLYHYTQALSHILHLPHGVRS